MSYIPTTDAERQRMLAEIGVKSVDDLFAEIPSAARLRQPLNLPAGCSEAEVFSHLKTLAAQNADLDTYACFMGGGVYDHLIPAALTDIVSRNEFVTAYTPYQPEVSQGVLQSIYEFQSLICLLTQMDVANASVYDGASACAEAALLACNQTRRGTILMAEGLHPEYRAVVQTYLEQQDLKTVIVPMQNGTINIEALSDLLTSEVAGVIVQHPNFFGNLEAVYDIGKAVHAAGAIYIACVDPISLGVLAPPGAYDADIAVGDGQSLGNQPSFGGPSFGFMAVKEALLRRLPGRIAGETIDHSGRRGFVLTLQTREQHIRRERAASNICTNQALNALCATVYLSLLGKQGLAAVANQCLQKAHYAQKQLCALPGWRAAFSQASFYQEFTLECDHDIDAVNQRLLEHKIIGGLPLARFDQRYANLALFCVTEARTRSEIDRLVDVLRTL
ncbi:MAG TPA: aminomethyl-transferring glycine dehydrogenase subunit GcvPA [Firmicutes bacterium]|nr:aminomethyl-transferring glycine dehydrogenase subunit GcvPA [Bacillota bacterium]